MSRPILKTTTTLLLAALAGSCALGPVYARPKIDTPDAYRWQDHDTGPNALGDANWWDIYQDPALVTLIKTALANNLDVGIAATRVDQAEATLGSTHLGFFPTIEGTGDAVRERESAVQTLNHQPIIVNAFTPSLTASYELDIWGRVRRLNEAARANLLSTKYAQQAVIVGLIAEVASTEFQLISLDSRLRLTKRTVEVRRNFVALTQARHQLGVISGLDVASAEAQLAIAEAQIPDIERQIALAEDQLSILLGENPTAIARAAALPVLPSLPSGLPSSLLERRPDVQEAEQQLVAANAQVGAAKAALFPTISLTGALGAVSGSLSRLASASFSTWSAGAAIAAPILDPTRNLYQLDYADATKRQALLQYQKTVQGAFKDVADALIGQRKNAEFVVAQEAQVTALRKADEIALARYRQGYASYFDVIDAESQLFTAELTLESAKLSAISSTVQLYQALGGGWQAKADKPAEPAAP